MAGAQQGGQVVEHAAVLHLGQAEDIGAHQGHDAGQVGELELIARLGPARPAARGEFVVAGIVGIVIGVEEILDVPAGDHHLRLGRPHTVELHQQQCRHHGRYPPPGSHSNYPTGGSIGTERVGVKHAQRRRAGAACFFAVKPQAVKGTKK